MRDTLRDDKENGHVSERTLDMALRIQKQCVDTVKAAGVLRYMESLGRPALAPLPHPPKIRERNE